MAVYDSYTKALLHFDGADGSNTITDESGKSWSASGNAQIDTAQYKFGGASLLLDGTNDYIYTADNEDFEFGNGDFSIDCWVRRSATGANHMIVAHGEEGNTSNFGYIFMVNNSNKLYFGYAVSSTFYSTEATSATISDGAWVHVAVVRNGANLYLFQDGNQVNTTHNITTRTINNSNKQVKVGVDDNSARDFAGWIDELRISKGVSRWTSNFTPPINPYGFYAIGNNMTIIGV